MLGIGGLGNIGTGLLTGRFEIGRIHRRAIVGMALSILALALASQAPLIVYAIMFLCGFTYIVSSGVLLLWGIDLHPDNSAFGLGLPQ